MPPVPVCCDVEGGVQLTDPDGEQELTRGPFAQVQMGKET